MATQRVVPVAPPSKARETAHKLLIELLSVETQNFMLDRAEAVKRIMEVGPTKTLASMAKKSALGRCSIKDKSRSIERNFLASSSDTKAIFYEYDEVQAISYPAESTPDQASVAPKPIATIDSTGPAIATSPTVAAAPSAAVPDAALTALDAVIAITSQKIKQPFEQLSIDRSLHDLSAGKSTLQNELVGDLNAELGGLPDGAEDLPLRSLAALFGSSSVGQPGKVLSRLISNLISAKMPAGFNQKAIRDHLQTHWGLGPGRQTTVLSLAATTPPSARLSSAEAAKDFFNAVTSRYAKLAELSLTSANQTTTSSSPQSNVVVDSEGMKIAAEAQKRFLQDQYNVLRNHLNPDTTAIEQDTLDSQASLKRIEGLIEKWYHEFSEEFLVGAEGKFEPAEARTYDSYWNWARIDLINFIFDLQCHRESFDSVDARQRLELLLQKWSNSCGSVVKELILEQAACAPELRDFWHHLYLRTPQIAKQAPVFKFVWAGTAPKCEIKENGELNCIEVPRSLAHASKGYRQMIECGMICSEAEHRAPFVQLSCRNQHQWSRDKGATAAFMEQLSYGANVGFTFAGKVILVTGAGPHSIGAELVRNLLCSGAEVLLTTSREVSHSAAFYNSMYKKYGARGSRLTVLPFNQGSRSDCEALIQHIYNSEIGPDADIDFIIPFAALPEAGRQIDGLDGKSELAHRAMLVNILRLIGYVKQQKQKRGLSTRPTNVIVPLSPNHGIFGGDGLYSESKIGLETLFNRWRSEAWADYLTICGAEIGWTRGTGLMEQNDMVAEAIESQNILTFSQSEMAFNLLVLMTPEISSLCEDAPIYADMSGGLQNARDLKSILVSARKSIMKHSTICKALNTEDLRQQEVLGNEVVRPHSQLQRKQRARINLDFPSLKSYDDVKANTPELQDMVDLSRTVVVVGFSDLGPWGNSRTRWDMELYDTFALERWIEMAWIMGLVQHRTCNVHGTPYSGWFDVQDNCPVADDEFESRYREKILHHSGIRLIEPEGLGGYDPERKEFLQEIVVDQDLPPFETSKDNAEAFKLRHGNNALISPVAGSEDYKVTITKGSHFLVPKAVPFDRTVAGQLPRGWDPARYGIPSDIVSQVDPITLYALCCTCEALWSAGIEDPFELYKHIHVSELANCIGTGVGGLLSMRGVYRDRYLERPVQHDILQESYLNSVGAWTNMLLLGSAGPIKSPVGTCATAVESLDSGCEALLGGKAKVAVVGGSDDFQEEMSFEFANMKATASAIEHLKAGRLPSEMSRPTASSRKGFVESAGAGVQIIMNAELAFEMGLPIYGIVAHAQMAGDGIGRSVPAPGQGILTAARESSNALDSQLLDFGFRRAELLRYLAHAEELRQQALAVQVQASESTVGAIDQATELRKKQAQKLWNNDIRLQDPGISPIKAALATWGLTVDDIGVVTLHGTSTKANDNNESMVINQMMDRMGRTRGNPLLSICQKYLTGHPKGAAGAWMFNGGLQVLQSGSVPGNRNADNIDRKLQQYEHLVYPSGTIHTPGVKAFMLTSFGFGQKGGLAIVIASQYLFSAVSRETYENYCSRTKHRQQRATTGFIKGLMENSIFKAKKESLWHETGEGSVFLNPAARAALNDDKNLAFSPEDLRSSSDHISQKAHLQESVSATTVLQTENLHIDGNPRSANLRESDQTSLGEMMIESSPQTTVGVDVESLGSVPTSNQMFIERNFSVAEQNYCKLAPDPAASFAGQWAAKKAVFKSLEALSLGADQAMKEVEIQSKGGIPKVHLHGRVQEAAENAQLQSINASLTHSSKTVMAVALATQ